MLLKGIIVYLVIGIGFAIYINWLTEQLRVKDNWKTHLMMLLIILILYPICMAIGLIILFKSNKPYKEWQNKVFEDTRKMYEEGF